MVRNDDKIILKAESILHLLEDLVIIQSILIRRYGPRVSSLNFITYDFKESLIAQ